MSNIEKPKANPAAEFMEQALGKDIVIFGTVQVNGKEMGCYLEQYPQPNYEGDGKEHVTYRMFVKNEDGTKAFEEGFGKYETAPVLATDLLSTFKRMEKPLVTKDKRVTEFMEKVGARIAVQGVAIYKGKIRRCGLLQRITTIGHPENVLYTVMIGSDKKNADDRMFSFMKDGTSAYQEDPGPEFWQDLDTVLSSFEETEDPEVLRLQKEYKKLAGGNLDDHSN